MRRYRSVQPPAQAQPGSICADEQRQEATRAYDTTQIRSREDDGLGGGSQDTPPRWTAVPVPVSAETGRANLERDGGTCS